MIARALGFALLAAACAPAQLRLYVVSPGPERLAGPAVDIGLIEAGETLEATFRIRNRGEATQEELEHVSLTGTGFRLSRPLWLPLILAPRTTLDFGVKFEPASPGSYSAVLRVNSDSYYLLAESRPGPAISAGGQGPLVSGDTVDFGAVERGASGLRGFTIENRTPETLVVSVLEVTGGCFRGPIGQAAPLSLAPGETAPFEIAFEPRDVGPETGMLQVAGRTFLLSGIGIAAPLLPPAISFEPRALRSAQQGRLSLRFAGPAPASGAGRLQIGFEGPSDPAIRFLSPGGQSVMFTVKEGDDTAWFAGRTEIEFQTGTTAGTIVFTAELGDHTVRASAEVPAVPVAIESIRLIGGTSQLELRVGGFDNSRTASQLAFTFFDRNGRMLGAGPIRTDAASGFQHHFETSGMGGMFFLRALFPVAGDVKRIGSVELELLNSQGASRASVTMAE